MILCCGEALIDFIPLPGQYAYQPCPGGSIFNIAIGLGRLGAPVGFFCKISTDFFGDSLLSVLTENHVDTSLCRRAPNPTTLAFVSLAAAEGAEPRFSFYANDSADRSLSLDDLPQQLPDQIRGLHFGSISLVLEPGASALEELMGREGGKRIISLDPNIRPSLIPVREEYRERFEKWLTSVDILKLSRADREWIYPDLGLDECFDRWFDRGVSLILLTRGAEGAEAISRNGKKTFGETPRMEVADTVGAGDTFMAAALAYLMEKEYFDRESIANLDEDQLAGLLGFANRAAAINCARVGADPPNRQELNQNLPGS
jgi:fructokinase